MHNSIVFDTELHHLWSADSPALNDADILMQNPTNTEFGGFQNSTTSTGTFTQGDGRCGRARYVPWISTPRIRSSTSPIRFQGQVLE